MTIIKKGNRHGFLGICSYLDRNITMFPMNDYVHRNSVSCVTVKVHILCQ